MDGQQGQDLTVSAFFENSAGPISDVAATFTVAVTNRATGATLVSGTPTESPSGSGYYEYTIDNSLLTGRMRIKVTWTNATNELYAETFYSIGDIPSWARRRSEIRRRVASRVAGVDDRIWQERAASGTTTTAVIDALVIGGEHEYRGCWLWFASGANEGQERRVTGFTASTATLTFSPAVGTSVTANDRLELYPATIRPTRVNDAIDDAVSDLTDTVLIDVDEQVLATDGTTYEWELPSDLRYVYRVGMTRDSDGVFLGWYEPGSWCLLPNRRLRVDRGYATSGPDPLDWGVYAGSVALPDGYTLRVLGLASVDPPLYDDSSVDIPAEALVTRAAYRLALTMPMHREVLPLWRQDAQDAKNMAATSLPTGVREVKR